MTNEERDDLARRVTEKVRRLGHWSVGMVDSARRVTVPLDIDSPATAGVLFSRIVDQHPEASIVNYDAADVDHGEAPAIVSWAPRHSVEADTWQRAVALAYLEVRDR